MSRAEILALFLVNLPACVVLTVLGVITGGPIVLGAVFLGVVVGSGLRSFWM